jgi:hypothetical protein
MKIHVEGMPNPDEIKQIIDRYRHTQKGGGSDY